MANPRAKVSFRELRPVRDTYSVDGVTIVVDTTQPGNTLPANIGKAVMMSGQGIVALASDGARIVGILDNVEADGRCAVHVGDYIQCQAGAAIPVGSPVVGAVVSTNRGYVRAAAAATLADVANQIGTVVEGSDPTKITVKTS